MMSGLQVSEHFYNDTTINIELYAEDVNGCKDTSQHFLNIYPVPTANFNSDSLWGCDELTVQFYDASVIDSALSYAWEFEGHGTDSV